MILGARTSRAMPWAAITTRCCVHGYRNCVIKSPRMPGNSAIGSLPTAHPSWKYNWRKNRDWAGVENTRSCFPAILGEIYTDLPLPVDKSAESHCGTCQACLDICPTQAIVAPYTVDARRCISYLTIELKGSIPEEFRSLMGNRIYGCDDCQLACPWNRFAKITGEADFHVRQGLDDVTLVALFAWEERDFQENLAGSAIYRIGYEQWLRNLAVALGNAPSSPEILSALNQRADHPSPIVREHVAWALSVHRQPIPQQRR